MREALSAIKRKLNKCTSYKQGNSSVTTCLISTLLIKTTIYAISMQLKNESVFVYILFISL